MLGKIFVFVGKTASGKDTITKEIVKKQDVKKIITYTTREPREGEVDGIDYHFVDDETFEKEDFVCEESYYIIGEGYRKYGVKQSDLTTENNVVIILTPSGYRELKGKFGDRVVGYYIMAPRKERQVRYENRELSNKNAHDEFMRRSETDDKDFDEFEFEVENIVMNINLRKAIESVQDSIFTEIIFS